MDAHGGGSLVLRGGDAIAGDAAGDRADCRRGLVAVAVTEGVTDDAADQRADHRPGGAVVGLFVVAIGWRRRR